MLSTKPYLVRAFYEWIIDSGCTPYVAINANYPRCNVPLEYVENGEIIFNISPDAVRDVKIGSEFLEFRASFTGVIRIVSAPVNAILAIYAEENGQGMFFDSEEDAAGAGDMSVGEWSTEPLSDSTESSNSQPNEKKKASHLRLVE